MATVELTVKNNVSHMSVMTLECAIGRRRHSVDFSYLSICQTNTKRSYCDQLLPLPELQLNQTFP